ncbi:hypothetical protein TUM17577_16630 [Enterobacter asburiae]|nr:hypothetical protein TUM17577_16630 [Enterobacter asburiae]
MAEMPEIKSLYALRRVEGRVKAIFEKLDEVPDLTAKNKPKAKYNKE